MGSPLQTVNYPIPNGSVSDQRLTVSSSVVTFSAFATNTTFIVWDCQTADVMVTFDGSDPSSTNGHRLYAGSRDTWHVDTARRARFIRQGSTDGIIHASEFVY